MRELTPLQKVAAACRVVDDRNPRNCALMRATGLAVGYIKAAIRMYGISVDEAGYIVGGWDTAIGVFNYAPSRIYEKPAFILGMQLARDAGVARAV